MNKENFESLMRGMEQARAYLNDGARGGFVVHEPVDIKAIRAAAKKSQTEFANTYRLPVGTVRDWEQGRSVPDAPARVLLGLIQKDPDGVARMIEKA